MLIHIPDYPIKNDDLAYRLKAKIKKMIVDRENKKNWKSKFISFSIPFSFIFFLFNMHADFLYSLLISFMVTALLCLINSVPDASFWIQFKLSKKMNLTYNFFKDDLLRSSTLSSIKIFDEKYNLEKVLKAIEDYDFQSSDLSLLLKEELLINQKDLIVLSDDKVVGLYHELLKNKSMGVCKKFMCFIEAGIPIREKDISYFLNLDYEEQSNALSNSKMQKIVEDFKKREALEFDFQDEKIKIPSTIKELKLSADKF